MDINTNIAEACVALGRGSRDERDSLTVLHLIEQLLRSYGDHKITLDDAASCLSLIRRAMVTPTKPKRVVRSLA